MKRIFCLLIALLCISACAELNVVCSIFPQYDFTKFIAGDKAAVTQLLPAGMDSHEYEASPRDIISLNRADLFIYTDDELEQWLTAVKGSLDSVTLVRCAEGIDLEALNEEWEELHEDHEEEEHEHEHEHAYDAHIWLDPTLASVMADNILSALCEKDPSNAAYYTENCEVLKNKLTELDEKFSALFAAHPDCTLYFGGKFAYSHFIRHYGVEFVTAYSGCSDDGEPSVRTIVHMLRGMRNSSAKVIFTDELSNGEIAKTIAAEADCEVLLFHTCHNLSKLDSGLTYFDIMEMNYTNIERALNESDNP